MGTRCVTVVRSHELDWNTDEMVDKELFRFYRHWDGYPEGHGMDMARSFALADVEGRKNGGINNRNWAQLCFAKLFACNCDLEIEPHDTRHGDLDYIYIVDGVTENFGGKHGVDALPVTITVISVGWSDESNETLFTGTPLAFAEWVGDATVAALYESADAEEVGQSDEPVCETSACYWYDHEVEGSTLAEKGKHAGMWYVSKEQR